MTIENANIETKIDAVQTKSFLFSFKFFTINFNAINITAKTAKENNGDVAKAEADLTKAQETYASLPKCVGKILILNADGTETKINPLAIERGDYDGMTLKCG